MSGGTGGVEGGQDRGWNLRPGEAGDTGARFFLPRAKIARGWSGMAGGCSRYESDGSDWV